MEKPIKSLIGLDPDTARVGDIVSFAGSDTLKFDYCTECWLRDNDLPREWIGAIILDKPCKKHTHDEKD